MTIAMTLVDAPPLDRMWWQAGDCATKPTDQATLAYIFGPFPFASIDASWHVRDNEKTDCKDISALAFPDDLSQVGIHFGGRNGEWPGESKDHVVSQSPIGSHGSEPTRGSDDAKDSSDDEDPEDFAVLDNVVDKYMSNVLVHGVRVAEVEGRTLMIHDLLNKFKVEPDLMNLFSTVGVTDDIEYVYLPLTYLKTGQNRKNNKKSSRNKGYGFVHFSRADAADRFAQLIQNVCLVGTGRGVKQMHTTLAKFQGVAANLVELLDLDNEEWRPKQGYLYIRQGCSGSQPLERVGISSLRKFILDSRN
jgi:hypothetical protein